MRIRTIGKALVLAMAMSAIAALSAAQTAQKTAFEVASVKLNAHTGFSRTTLQMAGSRFSATGMPLRSLIMHPNPNAEARVRVQTRTEIVRLMSGPLYGRP
jgi:hypothetical protein